MKNNIKNITKYKFNAGNNDSTHNTFKYKVNFQVINKNHTYKTNATRKKHTRVSITPCDNLKQPITYCA